MGRAMTDFIHGALTTGYLVAGLFFVRFWRDTRDRLFALFAAAFWLLALQRCLISLSAGPEEDRVHFYLIRLAAYLLILGAVVDKNRGRGA